eukprot:gene9891-biopygen2867
MELRCAHNDVNAVTIVCTTPKARCVVSGSSD